MNKLTLRIVFVLGVIFFLSLPFKAHAASLGSGNAIGEGYFVTAYHVVEGASKIVISVDNNTKDRVYAEVVFIDKEHDIAILKADLKTKGVINTWNKAAVGSEIYSCGYSFYNLNNGCTFNKGYVNANSSKDTFLPVNNSTHPGDSGSGVVDKNGALIGLVDASYTQSGIPITGTQRLVYAEDVYKLLDKNGLGHLLGKYGFSLKFYNQVGIAKLLQDSAIFIVSLDKDGK